MTAVLRMPWVQSAVFTAPVQSSARTTATVDGRPPLKSGYVAGSSSDIGQIKAALHREVASLEREARGVRAQIETLEATAGADRSEIDRLKGIEAGLDTARSAALDKVRTSKKGRRADFDIAKALVDGEFSTLSSAAGPTGADAVEAARKKLLGTFARASIEAGNKKPGAKLKYSTAGWLKAAVKEARTALLAAGAPPEVVKTALAKLERDLGAKHTDIANHQRRVSTDRGAFQATHKQRARIQSRRNKRARVLEKSEANLARLKPKLASLEKRIAQVKQVITQIDMFVQQMQTKAEIARARHDTEMAEVEQQQLQDKLQDIQQLREKLEQVLSQDRQSVQRARGDLGAARSNRTQINGVVALLSARSPMKPAAPESADLDAALADLSRVLVDEAQSESDAARKQTA